QRKPKTAKRLRSLPIVKDHPKLLDDFKTSMAIYLMWNGKPKYGFHFAKHRHNAIMFPQIVPKSLRYCELTNNPENDVPRIILEQGVGDVVLYLAHIRQQGHHDTSTFFGIKKYGSMVRRWFPQAKFHAIGEIPKEFHGLPCHCSADFLRRSWVKHKTLYVNTPLPEIPRRGVLDKPVYGICWRGGSGQNRREERHINIHHFLDLLPHNAYFTPLQFDLTDDERDIFAKDSRIIMPFADVMEDPIVTVDIIRDLAGVISVDSANWHFAGISNVPILAIMNKTPHWFWGPDARVENTYSSATTVPKPLLTHDIVKDWMSKTNRRWRARPKTALPAPVAHRRTQAGVDEPLFIASLPRSRSSMTMSLFAHHGVWAGKTLDATINNPKGFYENVELKEKYLKAVLKDMNADPVGVHKFPPMLPIPAYPKLRYNILTALQHQGYKNGPWGFKDPKITLLWPMWAKAFPNAHWLILDRDKDDMINSICRTTFMAQHSTSPEFWQMFYTSYQHRLGYLEKMVPRVLRVNTDDVIVGDYSKIEEMCHRMGLVFNRAKVAELINPVPAGIAS
ncbi:MAG: sulfotransferase, partial [Pseudomonadota bacterium]